MKKKSAWAKLKSGKQPKIVRDLPAAMQKWLGGAENGTMLVSTPEEVEKEIAKIPRGHVIRLTELRAELARQHGATTACPLSTAIFVNIVARAYAEREEETGKVGVPWWRVLRSDGKLNDKFPGGIKEQAMRLRAEGIEI